MISYIFLCYNVIIRNNYCIFYVFFLKSILVLFLEMKWNKWKWNSWMVTFVLKKKAYMITKMWNVFVEGARWAGSSFCMLRAFFMLLTTVRNSNLNYECFEVSHSYNHFHNILKLFDVLPNFLFTTSKTMRHYYL